MWGPKKGEEAGASLSERESPVVHASPTYTPAPAEPVAAVAATGKAGARVGRTLRIKGELVGTEELVIDGEVEGTVDLGESRLTIAPQGRVQADIKAREIIIEGTVRGTARASDRLHIAKSGNVSGDLVAARVSIEDGAYFKGSIDIQKPEEQKAAKVSESYRATPTPLVAASKDKLQ
ncbi:MAG TPA: polymer-forming cytoskeletal protein [Candidatus Xenobia bacterium]|nr:polymer-forming cytoskeletal protein [Candidatus Xenobia bacterium]